MIFIKKVKITSKIDDLLCYISELVYFCASMFWRITMFDNIKIEKSMQLLKNGDTSAFDTIYEETHRMVFYIVYPIVKDYARAEDVTQNVYIKVYEKINLYKENTSAKAWIATIAKNLALNEYKKYKNDVVIDIEKSNNIPEDVNQENTPLIDLASENLAEDEFMVVMLCVCEGYKRREVAKILNLSTSGVTWKLDNALKKLKSLTEGETYENK